MVATKLTPIQRGILFISLSLATFMMVLDYSIANVSIPYIAGDLGASYDQGTYVITSFAVGNAIGLAMTGWMTKRVGEIKLITISLFLFTLFSLTCGLSRSLDLLVINRFIQGLVAGPMIPLSQSLVVKSSRPETVSRDLGIWTTIIITAPVVGPILGGYLSDWYHWSWIFYINIPVGLFCIVTIWPIMHKHESPIEKVPSDIIGIILLTIGVTCLQIMLDKGQEWDWSNSYRIRTLFVGAIVAFTFLIMREFWFKTPLVDLRLFKIATFTISILCLMVSYAIYFGTIVLVPLWLQEYMDYNAEWAGFVVAFLGIAPIIFSILIPKIIRKIGNMRTLTISFVVLGASCFYSSFFTTDIDWQHLAFGRFFFGLGLMLYFNPILGMSIQDISKPLLPSATGLFHFIRAMISAVGTSIFTTLWIRRTYFHHERLGEALTRYNPITPQAYDMQSLQKLNNMLDQQAAMLSINDAFWLMGWLYILLVVLLVVWQVVHRKKPTPLSIHEVGSAH